MWYISYRISHLIYNAPRYERRKMDYRAFAGAVEKQMNQKMAGGAKAGLYTTTKNNGKERTGVLIETPGVNISPTIYLKNTFRFISRGRRLKPS